MYVDLNILSFVFLNNVAYITASTLRMMLTMKGYRLFAALLSIIEVIIYIMGLSIVMENLDNFLNVGVYALGFGIGIYIGMVIEDRLALGYSIVEAIVLKDDKVLSETLRDKGFGVTVSYGYGRDGMRQILQILTPRKYERELYCLINEISPNTFVVTYEPKYIQGGFWTKRVRKQTIKNIFKQK